MHQLYSQQLKKPLRMRRNNRHGNMLVVTSIFMALLAVFVIVGCSYAGLLFIHNRLESTAGEISLAGAMALNKNDRVGQMNNMIARCRQLVYDSHQTMNDIDPTLQHLAQTLYEEDVESAQNLENLDRKKLLQVCEDEAKAAMEAKFNELKPGYQITLPWLRLDGLTLKEKRLGKIKDIKCNVYKMTVQEELASHDTSNSYMELLYKDDINARIPDDGGLNFKLASLAAPIDTSVPPARLTLAEAFLKNKDDHLHSATQVELELNVKSGLGGSASQLMRATGTAATTGGAPQQ
jgi:hypothetical protein